MNACLKGDLSVVKLLLSNGSDIKATNAIGDSCVTMAQKSGNQEVVMELISKGAALRPGSGLKK